ncbi:hypothetical protein BBEV_1624 [Salisediminibacterium beveridgei]|uniref:Uncharacterized protein n=1 Tax=Salisediminibacterium beveridgei TaxID=632773 RepID=A0A1D7QVF1_9BACI|nr:hypothetical protein BBEV_1624 [Salisediminibacterium beveridgei]
MDHTFIEIMRLQGELQTIHEADLRKLERLISVNPCRCEKQEDCKGICSVKRRLNDELERRQLKRER